MREIREKPIQAAHIKEKVISTPKELLRKGLDDGTERLRTQLRDAAQQGQRDEYGGDAVEDTAAGAVCRVERELRKRGEHTERRVAPEGKNAPGLRSGTASNHAGQARGTAETGVGPNRSSQQNRAEQGFTRQTAGPKAEGIRVGMWSTAPTAESMDQGRRVFIRERGRKAAQRRLRDRRDILRHRNNKAQTGDAPHGEDDSYHAGRIKERDRALGPSIRENANGIDRVQGREGSPASGSPASAAGRAHRAAREAVINASRYQQAETVAQNAARKVAQATGRVLRDIRAAAQSLATALATGGSAALALLLVVCLIGLLLASPFGVFLYGQDSGTGYTMPEAVAALNEEFSARIQTIQAENFYDELDMDNAGSAAMITNWRDVLAVYAVRTAMDETAPEKVATLTEEKVELLRQIFWDMNLVSHWLEKVPGEDDEDGTAVLHITVEAKDYLQMADAYHFNVEQRKLLEELMRPEYQELFLALTGSYQDIALSPEEIAKILEKLPADLSEERKEVVLRAYQLLGRVHYFWGGKSLVLGWDSRWGIPMTVTAAGSLSTGTVRPFGLDCSGFVDWVFYNQSGGSYVIGHGGGASAQHGACTPISWTDVQPGDLVFYPDDVHVGIICGFDADGGILIIHCASGYDNVVVTGRSGFVSAARPNYFAD